MVLNKQFAEAARASLGATAFWLATAALILLSLPASAWHIKHAGFISIAAIGAWRYTWFLVHVVRAWVYTARVFPGLRAKADAAPFPRRVFFVIPSYGEVPFISEKVFAALMREIADLPSRVTLVVSVGSAEESAFIREVMDRHARSDNHRVIFMRQQHGKRIAMGHGLRAVAREFNRIEEWHNDTANDVVVFMDGDTEITPGAVRDSVRFFTADPRVGALTTHETGVIYESPSPLVEPWFRMKFSRRHTMMKSHSLSRRVLTLTGRFSVFRAHAVVNEDFIRHMEADHLTHWLFGRFRFLMGDDKSSWFYLLKNGWDMLYVPDVVIRSLESRTDTFFKLSRSLMVRWYGNMLRNNGRALALGPRRTGGLFIWLCILDQRISMWTSLVGPVGALLMATAKGVAVIFFYLAWVILVRTLQVWTLVAQGHRFAVYDVPLLLYDQWFGALLKIYNLYFPNRQKWAKRGAAQTTARAEYTPLLERYFPYSMMSAAVVTFVAVIGFLTGVIRPVSLLPSTVHASHIDPIVVYATRAGVVPNDGLDDAAALNALLERLPDGQPVEVVLPAGQLDFSRPLLIRRGDLRLVGKGAEFTHIVARFAPGESNQPEAVIDVQGRGKTGVRLALAEPMPGSATSVRLDGPLPEAKWLWIGAPNDGAFLAELGAKHWDKPYPWLRQTIVPVTVHHGTTLELARAPALDLPTGAHAQAVDMLTGVVLEDFTVRYVVPEGDAEQTRLRFENLHPDHRVDLVRFEYVAHSRLSRLRLEMAGRHPVSLEHSSDNVLSGLAVEGAWNKGPGGSGYVRLARSYHNLITESTIAGIRHLTVQWSASGNRIEQIAAGVDVNFHGGFSHHNLVRCVSDRRPAGHPWPAISVTPADARWAPPDGPGNEVVSCDGMRREIEAPQADAQSPAAARDEDG